ncbi:MAG: hypothetical protein OEQ39_15115 [Gammaproteobacteria bacterium]|nr:hypothetical protein [Gammaproteobacteria bacterium]
MARTLLRTRGRRATSSFVALPHNILESVEFSELSNSSVRALLSLFGQYRGNNNGDFTAAWSVMQRRGWKSKGTLYRAINELQDKGWILKTRQGSKNRCSLYAVTWLAIDECGGKLDVSVSKIPAGTWRKISLAGPLAGQVSPAVVPIRKTG